MRIRPGMFIVTIVVAGWMVTPSPAVHAFEPATGPRTDKRFPPLQVPKGFRATLFACDPLVEYPSVIAIGPKPGTLFVAHDYVTGLGIKIVRRDEVRLLQDTNGDGYADNSTVYAGGFNSIQGLAYDNGTVFVMHAPLLTALKDTNGDGKADSRRDIVKGLGLPPEKNPNRLHCANGVVAGHDGWLYLALGDRGCDVQRAEGDRLLFQQGGILRCRPDGRDLHVFAGGLRNIYDVALDEELNVFVRDNENDGGDYMIRVCRSFFGADHGYPYLYRDRPSEALRPLADLGRGSSAGGTSYLETAFPKSFRESLFFCEWGRAVVRYDKSRAGSHFVDMKEVDFAAAAANDPYGFKPTDVIVDYDGSLLISDWGDGQRPKRGRGRIYRITYVGKNEKRSAHDPRGVQEPLGSRSKLAVVFAALNSPGYLLRIAAQRELARRGTSVLPMLQSRLSLRERTPVRGANGDNSLNAVARMHAVWLLAELRGLKAVDELFRVAQNDDDRRVRAQAVRVIADLTDPVIVRHRLSAGRGDTRVAARLSKLVSKKQDPRVVLEVLIALDRLRWAAAPGWLRRNWESISLDHSIEHAAMQLLRRCDNWPAVLQLLDAPSRKDMRTEIRTIALRALADRAETVIVDGLIERLKSEKSPTRLGEYVDALARVYKKPAPWTYWGFRPAPRPANTVAWKRTETIGEVLNATLADRDVTVRAVALKRMRRESVSLSRNALADWLKTERNHDRVKAILKALATFPLKGVHDLLERVARDRSHSPSNRMTALALTAPGQPAASAVRFFALARSLEEGPVLAAAIRAIARHKIKDCDAFLLAKLSSRIPVVRAAAVYALGERGTTSAAERVLPLLSDADVGVLRSAAFAAGKLNVANAASRLRKLAGHSDREVCRQSLNALLRLRDAQAVPQAVTALKQPKTQLAALAYLAEFGDEKQTPALLKLAETKRPTEVTIAIVRAFVRWKLAAKRKADRKQLDRAIAAVHYNCGVLLRWSLVGPLTAEQADRMTKNISSNPRFRLPDPAVRIAAGTDAVVQLPAATKKNGSTWFAVAEIGGDKAANVEFLASATGAFRVWLNAKQVYRRTKSGAYRPDSDRFAAKFTRAGRRLVVRIDGPQRGARFHVRFREKSSKADLERLFKLALNGRGSALRGRDVFYNAEKSLCIRCHRMDDKGARIGPDLTGVGRRFSKIPLVESLLDPSRTIAPSYATYSVALKNGKVFSGVKTADTAKTLTLGDKDGKTHAITKSDIEFVRRQSKSTMPEGLVKRLTDREFLDLIAYLLAQKKPRPKR